MQAPERRPGNCPLQAVTAFIGKLLPRKGTTMHDEIFPEDVEQWLERGARLIDVREAWEFDSGHIPASENLALQELSARFIPNGKPVVLICATGNRSGFAAQLLARQGVEDVANLLGGVVAWSREGRQLENGQDE